MTRRWPQGFTAADADKDGYLSKAEFARLGKSMDHSSPSSAEPRSRNDDAGLVDSDPAAISSQATQ